MKKNSSAQLFVSTGNLSDVVLNWFGQAGEKFDFYAAAYHSAARLLSEKSSEEGLRDIGACPVVFLYRHSLELYLKEILINGHQILKHEGKTFLTPEEILGQEHKLSKLWNLIKELYPQLNWELEATLEAHGKIINEFDKLDFSSFSFRYPTDKKYRPALKQNFRFDLRNFCNQMDMVLDALDGVSCAIAGTLDEMTTVN